MNPAEATREICWNVSPVWLMYLLLVPTVAVSGYGFWRRARLWRCGQPMQRFDRPLERLALLARHALLQLRTVRQLYPGVFHLMVFAGFLGLGMATAVVMLDYDLHTAIMKGRFYLVFQSLVVDLFGLLVMVGLAMAAARRWVRRPRQLVYTGPASWLLLLIFAIVLTGFLVEGWRIAATRDVWAAWSPVGDLVAKLSTAVMSEPALRAAHSGGWWIHLLLVYGLIAWAPFTKLMHIAAAPLSIFAANLDGHGRNLKPVDFESDAPLGVGSLEQLGWKDLLDLDACTECGRCTAVCPANISGKSLSPRDVILDLRRLMHAESRKLIAASRQEEAPEPAIPVADAAGAVSSDVLFECTTCAACLEACPVFIEQLPKILDVRRYLAMEEADYPPGMADAIASLERRGHPFPGTQLSRIDWAEGLDVPVMSEMEDPTEIDVLLWVGCATALLERNHSVIRSLAMLLEAAGVRFAILGREERCTGDLARRLGNELLFEQLAVHNIEHINRYGVQRIVTACPHCFHTLANDYRALGATWLVEHHTTYLARLVAEGQLRPSSPFNLDVTFHDPCYLGRYNRVFAEPRQVLSACTSEGVSEMRAHGAAAFCCGGGGGMAFSEERPEQRVNRERARQALETGADIVAVACPFCMTMLEDGIKAESSERSVAVRDIAELLRDAVSPTAR
jgi:Fe-S oxidoreductase/nitrate reductase gamma subunit